MALVKWTPKTEWETLRHAMDRWFEGAFPAMMGHCSRSFAWCDVFHMPFHRHLCHTDIYSPRRAVWYVCPCLVHCHSDRGMVS
jgi:hypothetical protein